jgi:predicted ATPase
MSDCSTELLWIASSPTPLGDHSLFGATVAHVLPVREQPGTPVIETLASAIAETRSLVVLDNTEHLLPEALDALNYGCGCDPSTASSGRLSLR